MNIQAIIEKWKLNKGLLASKIEMPLGTFCNKLSPKHPTQFTDAEMIRLKLTLKEMGVELDSASDIGFDDAMKVVVRKLV